MKIITQAIIKKLPALGSTSTKKDPMVFCKFFTPWSNWTWYATEGEKQEDGDFLFFGLVEGHESELGYFRLSDLMSVRGRFGLKIERDLYFTPVPLSVISNVKNNDN